MLRPCFLSLSLSLLLAAACADGAADGGQAGSGGQGGSGEGGASGMGGAAGVGGAAGTGGTAGAGGGAGEGGAGGMPFDPPPQVVYQVRSKGVFVAPLDGSSPAQMVSAPLPSGHSVGQVETTADGARIVYSAGPAAATVIYSVRSDGTDLREISQARSPGYSFGAFYLSPEGTHALYGVYEPAVRQNHLHTARLDGTDSRRVDPAAIKDVYYYAIAGDRAVYHARDTADERALHSVKLDGSDPLQLIPNLSDEVTVHTMSVSPDGEHVLYVSNAAEITADDLYSAKVDGTGVHKVSATPGPFGEVKNYVLSESGARVCYLANPKYATAFEAYSAKIDGTDRHQLSQGVTSQGTIINCAISPDDSRVVFRGDAERNDVVELYSANVDGTDLQTINLTHTNPDGQGDVVDFEISSDSRYVAFRHNVSIVLNAHTHIFSGAIDGSDRFRLNPQPDYKGDVVSYSVSPDGRRVVYRGDLELDNLFELYAANLDGTSSYMKINPPLSGGTVNSFIVSADSTRAVYLADADEIGVRELYSVKLDGTDVKKLSAPLVPPERIDDYQTTP